MPTPLLLVAAIAAAADPADLAEADRLRTDMDLMVARAVWDGVDRAYRELEALEARGVVLTVEDHRQGAQAAFTRGDMAAARARLVRARALIAGTVGAELTDRIDDIDARYGQVELLVRGRKVPAGVLAVDELPLSPDERAAVLFAQARLAADHQFTGLLPRWSYALAGQPFRVEPGRRIALAVDAPTVLSDTPAATDGPRAPLRLPLLDLGLGLVAHTAPQADGTQAAPGQGLGLRAAIGLDFGDAYPLSAPLRLGYLSLSGEGDVANLLLLDARLAVHAGPRTFSLGPAVAAGRAVATGAAPDADWCGALPEACADAALQAAELEGTLRLVGGVAAAQQRLFASGPVYGNLGLEGGALYDGSAAWPWAVVLFSLEPVGRR